MDLPAKARIRPLATQDLEQIVAYLDARSALAGDQFLGEFFRAANLLLGMPRLGRMRRSQGRLKGLRSWPLSKFKDYLVSYIPTETGIDVIRVLHGAREIDRELRK